MKTSLKALLEGLAIARPVDVKLDDTALRLSTTKRFFQAYTVMQETLEAAMGKIDPKVAREMLAKRPDELRRVVVQQSAVTHRDPRCAAGALAIAGAAGIAATSSSLVSGKLLETLAGWIEPVEPRTAEALASLEPWLALEPAAAADRIQGLDRASPTRHGIGFTPFVTTTVAWSLYAFLRSPDDYLQSICTAIAAGGDTDTTAALTGAMAGARVGPSGLPSALVTRLEDRGTWRAGDLDRLARRCAGLMETPP